MPNVIKDGTGGGHLVKVCSSNALHTHSVAGSLSFYKAVKGDLFVVNTGFLNITATGGRAIWAYSAEPSRYIVATKIFINWNGGNTNHNRCLEAEYFFGDGMPTTNTTAVVAGNTNTGSSRSVQVTALKWDGVGDGMTGHSPVGFSAGSSIYRQGYTEVILDEGYIIAPGTSFSINLRGEEAGKASISFRFFAYNTEEESWT